MSRLYAAPPERGASGTSDAPDTSNASDALKISDALEISDAPNAPAASAASAASRFDDLMRLPPGPARQDGIRQIIADLAAALAELHEAGQVHGGICPAAIDHDPAGRPMLAAPPLAPRADAEEAARHAGYAAFEQYTDDPAHPCGPWTDVYGLAALAHFLATGSAPPDALARCVRDDCASLHECGPGAYDKAFCDAVDSGLAMSAPARPQSVAAFALAMGAVLPLREAGVAAAPTESGEAPAASGAESAPQPAAADSAQTTEAPVNPVDRAPIVVVPAAADAVGLSVPASARPADDDADPRAPAGIAAAAAPRSQPQSPRQSSHPPQQQPLLQPQPPSHRRRVLPLALACVLLLLAGGGYAWFRGLTPPVQVAGVPAERSAGPAPSAPPSQPPAAVESPNAPVAVAPPVGPTGVEPPDTATAPIAPPAAPGPGTEDPARAADAQRTDPGAAAGTAAVTSEPSASESPEPAPSAAAPSAPAADAPPEPPKAAPVAVRVAVRPWGEVLINGRSRGISPPLRELSLAPGRYQVTVRNASAGDHRMTLTVAPGKPATIAHEFE